MKIAVIHDSGSVGSWRWVSSVFGAIKKYYPETKITVFYKKNSALPEGVLKSLSNANLIIKSVNLSNLKLSKSKITHIKFIDNCLYALIKPIYRCFSKAQLTFLKKQISKYDIVFNSWFYSLDALKFETNCFFIPHDFIFTHFFGLHCGNVYSSKFFTDTRTRLEKYLSYGYVPCVATNYIKHELKKTFPEYTGTIHQIEVIPENGMRPLNDAECATILKKFDIETDYILMPTNNMPHKNMEEGMTAYYYVKQKYPHLKMIIIGFGTDGIRVQMNLPYYADHVSAGEAYDIKSLGLVSDFELNALLLKAKLVLNVSLCEAACGSGLDAWYLGVPTAISDIPPYTEQVETLGVKTEFFNPKNSESIAAAILKLLDNPEQAKENARISYNAVRTKYTAKDMADAYMKVFENTIFND